MKALTAVITVLACGAWLAYAFLAAFVAGIEGGNEDGQLAIAITSVVILAGSAGLAARRHRAAATVAMLLAAGGFVWWVTLLR